MLLLHTLQMSISDIFQMSNPEEKQRRSQGCCNSLSPLTGPTDNAIERHMYNMLCHYICNSLSACGCLFMQQWNSLPTQFLHPAHFTYIVSCSNGNSLPTQFLDPAHFTYIVSAIKLIPKKETTINFLNVKQRGDKKWTTHIPTKTFPQRHSHKDIPPTEQYLSASNN